MGSYLAVLQFFFTLTWTIYVIYLPALAVQAGIDKQWVVFILLADQVVFTATDWAMGVWADHVSRVFGRLGNLIALLTGVSCLAFLVLPFVAPAAGPVAFLALPDVKEKYKEVGGLEPYVTTPAELATLIQSEYAKYAKLVKDLGIVAQ